jgi:hypothetical protein
MRRHKLFGFKFPTTEETRVLSVASPSYFPRIFPLDGGGLRSLIFRRHGSDRTASGYPLAGLRSGSGCEKFKACRPRPSGKNNQKCPSLWRWTLFFAQGMEAVWPRPITAGLVYDSPAPLDWAGMRHLYQNKKSFCDPNATNKEPRS